MFLSWLIFDILVFTLVAELQKEKLIFKVNQYDSQLLLPWTISSWNLIFIINLLGSFGINKFNCLLLLILHEILHYVFGIYLLKIENQINCWNIREFHKFYLLIFYASFQWHNSMGNNLADDFVPIHPSTKLDYHELERKSRHLEQRWARLISVLCSRTMQLQGLVSLLDHYIWTLVYRSVKVRLVKKK